MNKVVKIIVCIALSGATCIITMLLSLFAGDLFKGRNYSDVGVPMYSGQGFPVGFVTYITLIIVSFFLWRKIKDIQDILLPVYFLVNVPFFVLFMIALAWVTG